MSSPILPRIAYACGLLLACTLLTGCPAGGGGFTGDSGSMTGGGMQTVFTADSPEPGLMSLSMSPGLADGDAFQVRIRVTGFTGFFGAAFRVVFDESGARFDGFSADGSFIEDASIDTDFRAVPDSADPGVILIDATRQGQVAGVDARGPQLLLTLNFTATGVNAGNVFSFDSAATRLVTTCPAPPDACTNVPDADLTWSGGILASN